MNDLENAHTTFVTTSRGLRRSSPPMRLYEKAKRLGIWNPADIDLRQDVQDWAGFTHQEKTVMLHLTSLFQAGEEAVTLDLLPLISVIASEGRLEEEIFLTTFLFEEGKHTDFFRRFLDEVVPETGDLGRFTDPNYRLIIYEALPKAMNRLRTDSSPKAQIEAAVIYNMIVEGVLAETGYHGFFTALQSQNRLPGMRRGIELLKLDESRHIAYGVYLLSRLVAANPDLWDHLEAQMNAWLLPAIGVIADIFERYDPMPFNLKAEDFSEFAVRQFNKRYERLEKARGASLEEVERITWTIIENEDA